MVCGLRYAGGVTLAAVDALAKDVRLWKERLVSEHGIGSDCSPSIYAFDGDDQLLGFAMLYSPVESRDDQFRRCIGVMILMREGWHASSMVVALEGYLTTQRERPGEGDSPLAERYAAGDESVVETISLIYQDEFGVGHVHSMPYCQVLGRRVEWLDEYVRDVSDDSEGGYPGALRRVFEEVRLRRWSDAVPFEVPFLATATQMSDLGFMVASPLLDASWGDDLENFN